MKKDYKTWTPLKVRINNFSGCPIGFKERQIWYASIGENVGFEEDGKGNDFVRPVLILNEFNKNFCLIIPLSTTNKRGKYYYPFDSKTGKISVALLSQIRSIDSVRLHRKIGFANKKDFQKIKQKICQIIYKKFLNFQ